MDKDLFSKEEVALEISKGFNSDPLEAQQFEELYKAESKKITKFQIYLLKMQNEDIVIKHIKECLQEVHSWPQNYEEIRARILKLFHVLKIGKDINDQTDLTKQQYMLLYLFRQKSNIFTDNHDILTLFYLT